MKKYRYLLISVVAVVIAITLSFTAKSPIGPGRTLAVQAPNFMNDTETQDIVMDISSEAGISAYLQTVNPINLNLIRGEYRTIETETADYIIGSVQVPDHPEHFDVHVYVHTDGWILAYYLNGDAVSKIVDVKNATISSTKLETIITIFAGNLGEAVTGLKYYDFRYPNATNILMVAEDDINGKDFTINLPTENGYFERSWAASGGWAEIFLNGTLLPTYWESDNMAYGTIEPSLLLPGQTHYLELNGYTPYGVLVITYRVP